MPFDVTLTQTGIDPQTSIQAFIQSYQETSKVSHFKKDQAVIEEYFKNSVNRNIGQMNIKDNDLRNGFSVQFSGNTLEFVSKNNKAMKYEYGSGSTPPRRFMEPAVKETANKISDLIINDAIDIYNKKTRITSSMKRI